MKIVISTFALLFFLTACSGNSPEPKVAKSVTEAIPTAPAPSSYALPSKDTNSVINEISATRTPIGAVVISGDTLLPPATKLWIERRSPSGKVDGQAEAFIDGAGKFSSEPFSDNGKAPKKGPQKIGLVSHFNKAWQQENVLSVTGEGGVNLPSAALKADDPEFPNAGRHLDEARTVSFPSMPEDVIAIDSVKNAKLYVQGQGQAVDTVDEIVAIFAKSPGFKPLGWSAEKSESKWIVTLDNEDGTSRRKAQWEFDPASGKVRYLDPLSKILSWIPAE